MIINEAVVLAGGLGTRLKSAVPDLPKCMAPVAGRPFIDYIIMALRDNGIQKIIFSLGYMSEIVIDHLKNNWPELPYEYCIETQPLGTGGAIKLAIQQVNGDHFVVVNGDTLFDVDLVQMSRLHTHTKAAISVALKPMSDFDRYGSVQIDDSLCIKAFIEKKQMSQGLINGGLYYINKNWFSGLSLPQVFSFEKDVLEKNTDSNVIFGYISDTYFIDIGIPEDFEKASIDLKQKS